MPQNGISCCRKRRRSACQKPYLQRWSGRKLLYWTAGSSLASARRYLRSTRKCMLLSVVVEFFTLTVTVVLAAWAVATIDAKRAAAPNSLASFIKCPFKVDNLYSACPSAFRQVPDLPGLPGSGRTSKLTAVNENSLAFLAVFSAFFCVSFRRAHGARTYPACNPCTSTPWVIACPGTAGTFAGVAPAVARNMT